MRPFHFLHILEENDMNRLHSTGIAILLLSAPLLSGCRSHEADIPEGDPPPSQTESAAPESKTPSHRSHPATHCDKSLNSISVRILI